MTQQQHDLQNRLQGRTAIAASALNLTCLAPQRGLTRRILVDQVSTNIEHGRWTTLAGRADSGAPELLRCLAGRLPADSGMVFLDGRELSHLDALGRAEARTGVAFVEPQPNAVALADAVARALATEPRALFVDTIGGAQGQVSEAVLAGLQRASREDGLTVVLATDDPATALRADRALVMAGGRIVEDL